MCRYRWMISLLVLVALVLSGCSPIAPPHPGSVPDQILFIGNSMGDHSKLSGTARDY